MLLSMLYRDTEAKRMYFFYTFIVCQVLTAFITIISYIIDTNDTLFIDNLAKTSCLDITGHTWFNSYDNCVRGMKGMVMAKLVGGGLMIAMVQLHCALVLYSHWLNAPLQKREGGCKDNETSDHDY